MARDYVSEEIAHFIGSLKLISEEPRLRTDHDAFEHNGDPGSDPGTFHNVTITVSTPYELVGLTSGLWYSFTPLPLPEPFFLQSVFLRVPNSFTPSSPISNLPAPLTFLEEPTVGSGPGTPEFIIPPPSSIAVFIQQQNFLDDSDILGVAGFLPASPEAQALALDALVAAANDLIDAGLLPPAIDYISSDPTTYAEPESDGHPLSESATVHVLTGDAMIGIHSNGVALEEAPVLTKMLPELPEPGDEDTPDHIVTTGGNTVVNEAYIGLSISDAPLIAVMGDSHSTTGICQVNVISDLDWVNGASVGFGFQENIVENISSVLHLSSEPEVEPEEEDEEEEDPVFPTNAAVVRIDGDVVNINHLQQQNFVVDNNIISMELTASATFIQSGGNLVSNVASLAELSYVYDMIVVGGDIVQCTVINQMNVLLDEDFVTYGPGANVDLVSDQNLLWNEATITAVGLNSYLELSDEMEAFGDSLESGSDAVPGSVFSEDVFEGIEVMSILYIEGDLISYQSIDQINVLANSDQVDLPSPEDAEAAGADITVTTGANALVNIAMVSEFGVDSEIHVGGEIYSDALMHQAGLVVTDDTELLSESGGLVTEAVAFLMDTSDPTQSGDAEGAHTYAPILDEMGSDPMGGVLA